MSGAISYRPRIRVGLSWLSCKTMQKNNLLNVTLMPTGCRPGSSSCPWLLTMTWRETVRTFEFHGSQDVQGLWLSFAGEALEISGPKAVFTGSLAGELLKYGLSHLSPPRFTAPSCMQMLNHVIRRCCNSNACLTAVSPRLTLSSRAESTPDCGHWLRGSRYTIQNSCRIRRLRQDTNSEGSD